MQEAPNLYEGSVANKALELLGTHLGMFVTRSETNVNLGWRFTIGKGYELDESEAPGHSPPVVNGSVLGELPPAAGAE